MIRQALALSLIFAGLVVAESPQGVSVTPPEQVGYGSEDAVLGRDIEAPASQDLRLIQVKVNSSKSAIRHEEDYALQLIPKQKLRRLRRGGQLRMYLKKIRNTDDNI